MEMSKKHFKKTFPNLAREMNRSEGNVTIDSIRSDTKNAEKKAATRRDYSNYNPDVIDFLRRCDTKEQAEEIIAYMEKRGEITQAHASKLQTQLKKNGLRSFGPKKEEGYYFRITRR